jgi:hypothetical protein
MRYINKILVGNLERKKFLIDLEANGRIILDRILKKQGVRMWIGFMWFRRRPVAGSSEYNNAPSGSKKEDGKVLIT